MGRVALPGMQVNRLVCSYRGVVEEMRIGNVIVIDFEFLSCFGHVGDWGEMFIAAFHGILR